MPDQVVEYARHILATGDGTVWRGRRHGDVTESAGRRRRWRGERVRVVRVMSHSSARPLCPTPSSRALCPLHSFPPRCRRGLTARLRVGASAASEAVGLARSRALAGNRPHRRRPADPRAPTGPTGPDHARHRTRWHDTHTTPSCTSKRPEHVDDEVALTVLAAAELQPRQQ